MSKNEQWQGGSNTEQYRGQFRQYQHPQIQENHLIHRLRPQMAAEEIVFLPGKRSKMQPKCGMRLQCDSVTSVACHIPQCKLIAVVGAQPRQLLVALHRAAHRYLSQLKQLTDPPTKNKHGQLWNVQEERELINFLSNHKVKVWG